MYWWRKKLIEEIVRLGVKAVKGPEKEVPEMIFTSSKKTITAFYRLYLVRMVLYTKEMRCIVPQD